MTKTMTRAEFSDLMAKTAQEMPLSKKLKKNETPPEGYVDYDVKSNEWLNAVNVLNNVGPEGRKRIPTPEGGFKTVPMTRLKDLPVFVKNTVAEAMRELDVEKITA